MSGYTSGSPDIRDFWRMRACTDINILSRQCYKHLSRGRGDDLRQLRRIGLALPFFAYLWNREPFSNSSNAGNPLEGLNEGIISLF